MSLPKLNNSLLDNLEVPYTTTVKPNISPNYNVIRDNPFFTNFAKNYNHKLLKAFEEADKVN